MSPASIHADGIVAAAAVDVDLEAREVVEVERVVAMEPVMSRAAMRAKLPLALVILFPFM